MAEAIRDVDRLLEVLAAGAARHDDEPVDLLAHALQCAEHLARRHPDDGELVTAGLVHDVGSVLAPGRPADHAAVGAAAVAGLLGLRVARLVAGHAEAKRYLVTTDPAYRSVLSARSVETLGHQGGVMAPDEVAAFEADLGAELEALLDLRRADDAAKVPGAATRPLPGWRPLLESLVRQAR